MRTDPDNIATVIADLRNLTDLVKDFREETRKTFGSMQDQIDTLRVTQAKQGERVSALTIFHTAFTTIVGAIATYLGASIK